MNTVLLVDPRIDINNPEDVEIVITQGAQRLTQYVQTADSSSTSQTNISFQPPSTKIIVDRFMQLRMLVKVTAVGGTFDLGTATALRQVPLASLMDVLNVTINGGNISDNISRRVHEMLKFNNNSNNRNRYLNKTASMPDQFMNYGDWQTYGSARNPLAYYGEVSDEQSRGGFPFVSAVETAPGSNQYTEIVYEITEPLFMSPFLTGLEAHPDAGFVNVNQIDVNIKWINDLSRIMSHVNIGGNTLTGVTVAFERSPEILVNYMTPDNNFPLPLLQVLPYYKYNDYIRSVGTIAGNASFEASSDTIKLNQIPRHLYIYVKRTRQTETFETSDTYARIDKLNILWNNESSLFSTYTKQGLFDICKRNGSNQLYAQYDKHCGSVYKLEFGSDLGLMSGLSPGVMGQFTISVTANCTNLNDVAVQFEMFMTTQLEGTLELSENALALNLGNLTVPQVMDAEMHAPRIHHTNPALGLGVEGGSFFSSLKSFVNKIARGVQKAAGFAGRVIAPALTALNPALGAAVGTGAQAIGSLAGLGRQATGGRAYGRASGGRASGGSSGRKRITRQRR